jgi:hypothetical protein
VNGDLLENRVVGKKIQKAWRRCIRRAIPLTVTIALTVAVMLHSFFWMPIVGHRKVWDLPGDIWATLYASHYLLVGIYGLIYSRTALVTFPGIVLILAPAEFLISHLHLISAYPLPIAKPTAWILLGPYEVVVSGLAVFSCDAFAERLGVSQHRRWLVSLATAVALWPVVAMWGHPEDAVALGLALYAMGDLLDHRWVRSGWLMGAAVVVQPLVLLLLPLFLFRAGWRKSVPLLFRAGLPSAVLLLDPLIFDWTDTAHALLEQPNYPSLNHATPWLALAPRLGSYLSNPNQLFIYGTGGHHHFATITLSAHTFRNGIVVAAGPGRLVAIGLAVIVGWWFSRQSETVELFLWCGAVALGLRCATEPVLVSFYLWPALGLGILVASRCGWPRFLSALLVVGFLVVGSNWDLGPWPYWTLINGGLACLLACGFPGRARTSALSGEKLAESATVGLSACR